MNKKLRFILEGVLVLVMLIVYSIVVVVPEYKKEQGSSDGFIQSKRYQNMIEVKNPSKFDIGFVLDSEGKIYHLFFFDKNATTLYNKNIENTSLPMSLDKTITILLENGLLGEGDSIEVIRNNDEHYLEFLKTWEEILLGKMIQTETLEKVQSLKERVLEIGVEDDSTGALLLNLDFYSKEFLRGVESPSKSTSFSEAKAQEYADHVYMKIEEYVLQNSIQVLDRYNTELVISLIPAEETLHYYPTTRSWYYVENGKVTAFIEFQENDLSYGYCYQGSVETRVKGECTS